MPEMVEARLATLRGWLDEELSFGALESRQNELDSLVCSCDAVGISLDALADLDAAIADARSAPVNVDVVEQMQKRQRTESESEPLLVDLTDVDPATAAGIAVCVGRYCALFEAHALALRHFQAAQAIEAASAAVALGIAQAHLGQGDTQAATACVLQFWRHAIAAPMADSDEARHLAFVLSHLVEQLELSPPPDASQLLRALTPFVHTPAASAVGSLFGLWLPTVLPAAQLLECDYALEALRSSNEFCRRELEPLVIATRCALMERLATSVADNTAVGGSLNVLADFSGDSVTVSANETYVIGGNVEYAPILNQAQFLCILVKKVINFMIQKID